MSWTNVDKNGLGLPLVDTLILAICLWIAIGVPLRQLHRPHSPILLSKRLRRFYQWQGKQKGWTALDYDQVVPFVTRLTVVSTVGAETSFFLDVGVFEPGTRKLAEFIRLSDPANDVLTQGELWEFVRAYMDGPASRCRPLPTASPRGRNTAFMRAWTAT